MKTTFVYKVLSDRGNWSHNRFYNPENEADYERCMNLFKENKDVKLVDTIVTEDGKPNIEAWIDW